MSWARLDDQYPDHPKIIEVGPLGMALHTAAICYCARYLTDGFVPASMIPRLINLDGLFITDSNGVCNAVTNGMITALLTKAGLFEAVEGGYKIHDYLEYNPPAARVKAERTASKARHDEWMANKRDKKGKFGGNGVSNGVSNGVCNAEVTSTPSPSPSFKESLSDDPFSKMQAVLETMIGVPMGQSDIGTVNEFVKEGIIEADIAEAINFFKGNGAYISSIRQIGKSVMVAKRKRIQAAIPSPPHRNGNGRPGAAGHYPAPEPPQTPEQIAEGARLIREARRKANGN